MKSIKDYSNVAVFKVKVKQFVFINTIYLKLRVSSRRRLILHKIITKKCKRLYHKEAFLNTVSFQAVTSTKILQVMFLQTTCTRQHYFSCQKCNFHRFTILLSMNKLHVDTFKTAHVAKALWFFVQATARLLLACGRQRYKHFIAILITTISITLSQFLQISNSKLKALDFSNSPNITCVTSFMRSVEKSSGLTSDF